MKPRKLIVAGAACLALGGAVYSLESDTTSHDTPSAARISSAPSGLPSLPDAPPHPPPRAEGAVPEPLAQQPASHKFVGAGQLPGFPPAHDGARSDRTGLGLAGPENSNPSDATTQLNDALTDFPVAQEKALAIVDKLQADVRAAVEETSGGGFSSARLQTVNRVIKRAGEAQRQLDTAFAGTDLPSSLRNVWRYVDTGGLLTRDLAG